MPTNCFFCGFRKRRDDRFTRVVSLKQHWPSLDFINRRRAEHGRRPVVEAVPVPEMPRDAKCKVCQPCYDQSRNAGRGPQFNGGVFDDQPDPSYIYRPGGRAHDQCTFGCATKQDDVPLVGINPNLRLKLCAEYRFFTCEGARICSTHQNLTNYWPLVKKVNWELETRELEEALDFMTRMILANEYIRI